jgi:hypothetical protein
MSVPHRNNPPPFAARRPHNHYEPPAQPTRRDKPGLAVVAPLIGKCQSATSENEFYIGEVQAALAKRSLPFRFIPRIHQFMYVQKDGRSSGYRHGSLTSYHGTS